MLAKEYNKQIKLVTVLGTRPEIIKMSILMKKLDEYCDHRIVHTGQNYDYELNEIFFNDLDLRPVDEYLNAVGDNFADTIGNILKKITIYLEKEKPDGVVVYGDTNSCLSVYVAKRLRIPIFHLEAGNRCFDFRVPEEINRKIVDHLSDINFVLSEEARENLLREGLPPNRIFNVGSNMPEIIRGLLPKIHSSDILKKLNLEKDYFLISVHREENVDEDIILEQIVNSINELTDEFCYDVVWSLHPRTRKKIESMNLKVADQIIFTKPLGLIDYLKLQKHCACLISDSGTVSEESSVFKIPSVTLRNSHERPEGIKNGVFSVASQGKNLSLHVKLAMDKAALEQLDGAYPMKDNSMVILKAIMSYLEYIRSEVWKM